MLITRDKEAAWICECCSTSFGWHRKTAVAEKHFTYDRPPYQAKVGDKAYPACSTECARTIYIAKGFERALERKS